jgi:Integrase zinc binding domain
LYQWEEPRATKIRQLQRRVVPKGLRRHIIVAYQATPLAGHVGIYETYWRIVTQYWWPSLLRDIKEAVTTCARCILGNNTKHQGQKVYKPIMTAEPFDIICLDIWHPGVTHTSKQRNEMDKNELKGGALLTSLCNTTSFATTAKISQVNSEEVRDKTFQQIMVPNGLPMLILIDQGSEFKGVLTSFCTELGIHFEVVSPEQHDRILCERFHRYLNKVMQSLGLIEKDSISGNRIDCLQHMRGTLPPWTELTLLV